MTLDNLNQDNFTVFASYATADSDYYNIRLVADSLTQFPEIEDVLYWEEDLHDNIIKYMNDNIGMCDIFLLFCSNNALKSEPVAMEWMAALKLRKKIIPIFVDESHIPPLLSPQLGVVFNKDNLKETISKIYKTILKKLGKVNITKVEEEKILEENLYQKKQPVILKVNEDAVETFKESMITKSRTILEKGSPIKQIFIAGDGGVGKTTFILRYCLDFYFPSPLWCANLFINSKLIDNETVPLFFWDIMGESRGRFLAEFFANDVDGVFLCFDITRYSSFESLEDWIKIFRKHDQKIPIILVGLKADLEYKKAVIDSDISVFIKKHDIRTYMKVSSKMGENINNVFIKMIDEIKLTPPLNESRIIILEKKIALLEYLKSYNFQGKEELKFYLQDYVLDDEKMQEAVEGYNELSKDELIANLLLFKDFKVILQKYIEYL